MVSKPGLIATAWQDYLTRVIHADADEVQKQETRRAFYAGAGSLLKGLMNVLEPNEEITEADMALMDSIQKELADFWQAMLEGKA